MQIFRNVPASKFARPPDRPYRCEILLQGSRGFYVRAYRALLPPHAPDMLTVRIQAIDGTGTCTLLDSQPCRLLTSLHPVSGTSSLLRVVPPLGSASVLLPSWFFHLRLLRSHRSPRFPRSARSPLTSSGHLNAGCRFGPSTGIADA